MNEEKELLVKEKELLNSNIETYRNQSLELEKTIEQTRDCMNTSVRESEAKSYLCDQYKKKLQEISYKYAEANSITEKLKACQEENLKLISDFESRLENEIFKNHRLNEDLALIKQKLDRATHNQYGGATDKILIEELRILKQKLICSCCGTRQKDAILTKCYHLFCFECLATTYNNRQRKCPRCSQSFGNHDFHKIYF
ncbi:E3 ubiquitin-protein ligase BRE1A [Thelohanellus kitauei]|uniref:E3 ubiquitin protein ligase n=1 Tax=Thelohanellus kitauei TaxID=669202 RepID=A0A0C2MS35_THEKT|nr:E3 ubiquitin-protein ligase BRE1A [Thelohanellus kitauei]